MFIGHYAPALIAAACPRAPRLGTLFVAAQLVDIGFFSLTLAGVESMRITPGISAMNSLDLYHMPYTHSLIGNMLWAAVFAGLLWLWRRDTATALIGGAVVLCHWFVDLVAHIPDLTLWGGPPRLGLGLWNHPAIAMPLELGLTFAALLYYALRSRADASTARLALGLLALALLTAQVVDWFGPPPDAANGGIALTALAAYLVLALLAAWVGATRRNPPLAGIAQGG